MKTKRALVAVSALAQESRLAVFRLLVKHGPDGLTAGVMAELLAMPSPTLSFHLKALAQSGLDFSDDHLAAAFNALVEFLTEDCCQGLPDVCSPENPK